MQTELSQLLALMTDGRWDAAIAFANRFPRLGEHATAIRRAHNAILRPGFYRQLGLDPAALREKGIRALRERYARADSSAS
jgi:hypothetical protein